MSVFPRNKMNGRGKPRNLKLEVKNKIKRKKRGYKKVITKVEEDNKSKLPSGSEGTQEMKTTHKRKYRR